MTIDEILYYWTVKYKYDHILHGFKFEEEQMTTDKAHETVDNLKSLYGDIL